VLEDGHRFFICKKNQNLSEGGQMKQAIVFLLLVSLAVAVFAAPMDEVISFQGKIVESGTPPTGMRNIEFKIYDVAVGGTALWTENHLAVPVTAGLFNVELGSVTAFAGASVDFSEQYWVGITVAGGLEITPRYKFGSSPYALNIADVIVKSVDQVFETDLHLDSPTSGDRAIWFGDDHYVGVGEYPLNDDDLLLYCTGDPVWVDAADIRPTGTTSDLGDATAEWRNVYLSGRIYADGSSPSNKFLGTDATGYLTYLSAPGGSDDDWAYASGTGLTGDIYHTGNVGIGTTSPAVPLHIDSDGHALYIDGAGTISTTSFRGLGFQYNYGSGEGAIMASYPTGVGYLTFHTTTGGTMAERMRITPTGDVGIGTTSPEYPLHVTHTVATHDATESPTVWAEVTDGTYTMTGVLAGQNGFQGVYGTTDKPSGYGVYGRTTGGASSGVYGYATGSGTTNYGVRGQASGATRNWGGYFIGDGYFSGNVGIGTTSPDAGLHIRDSGWPGSFLYLESYTAGEDAGIRFLEASIVKWHMYNSGYDDDFVIYNNDLSQIVFRADQTGHVAIGSVTPDATAILKVGSATGDAIRIGSQDIKDSGAFEFEFEGNLNPNSITRDIGNATDHWDDVYADDFVNISDARLKTDVKDIPYGLTEIMQLRPVSYILKSNPQDGTDLGLIAQELLPIIEEAVATHDYRCIDEETGEMAIVENEFMGIDYVDLIPVLIKATQEQQAQIEELKAEIENLKNNK